MRQELISHRLQTLYESQAVDLAGKFFREIDDTDELDSFQVVAQGSTGTGGDPSDVLVGARVYKNLLLVDQQKLRANVYLLYYSNPHVRGVVRNLVKFVFGKGMSISFESKTKNKSNEEAVDSLWKKFEEVNKWTRRQKELGIRSFRDGESFLQLVGDEDINVEGDDITMPTVVFREPDQITSKDPKITFGIETQKDNVEKVVTYRMVLPPSAEEESVQEEDMVHFKFGVDANVKRGRSMLEPVLKYIIKYGNWIDDRMTLNKIRTALALVKTVTGGTGAIQAIREKNRAEKSSKQNRAKMLTPGSVITASPGVKYEMLSAQINAGDVKDDGQALLVCIATGCGIPYMFLTGDFSNANYSSSLTAQNPFVREAEDWQDTFEEYVEELIKKVFAKLIADGHVTQEQFDDVQTKIEWPPLTYESLQILTASFSQMKADGIVSNKTYAQRLGFDYDEELEQIEKEETYLMQKQADMQAEFGGGFPQPGFGGPPQPGQPGSNGGAPGGGGPPQAQQGGQGGY